MFYIHRSNHHQWNGQSQQGRRLSMLHSDMILKRSITVDANTKEARCSNSPRRPNLVSTSCPLQLSNAFASHVSINHTNITRSPLHPFPDTNHCPKIEGEVCLSALKKISKLQLKKPMVKFWIKVSLRFLL